MKFLIQMQNQIDFQTDHLLAKGILTVYSLMAKSLKSQFD